MFDSLRHALRRLRARPAATALAVSMLALGIGLATAMATIVDALVFRRLPFDRPHELVMLSARQPPKPDGRGGTGRMAFAWPVLRAWRTNPAFAAVEGVAKKGDVKIDSPSGPLVRRSATVTPGLFAMLGVRPSRGAALSSADGRAGTDSRVVMSQDLWPAISGGRAFVPGMTVRIDDEPVQVIGLMPSGFRFPDWNTQLWRAADPDAPPAALANDAIYIYARMAPNISRDEAYVVAARQMQGLDARVTGMVVHEWAIVGGRADAFFSKAVPVVAIAIALVFIVLCANVASLLLAQLTTRRRQYGMCAALGASRARLLNEAFLESAVLVVASVVTGIAVAFALVGLARGYLPSALVEGSLNTVELDVRALVIAIAGGAMAAMFSGLLPAWIGTRVDPADAMRGSSRATTESRAARFTTRGLLVTEIALTCVLLVGATLLLRSFVAITSANRGLNVDGVVTTWVSLDKVAFKTIESRRTAMQLVEDAVRAIPGVRGVDVSFGVPPQGSSIHYSDTWLSELPGAQPLDLQIDSYGVSAGFFALYEIPLLRGRTFADSDSPSAVIVGERMAKLLWPGVDPVGRAFTFDNQRYDVIGVAREIAMPSLNGSNDRPEFYTRFTGGRDYVSVSVRCSAACPPVPDISRRLSGVAPGISARADVPDVAYRRELERPKAAALLGALFAVIAVVTAAGGLFSVLSFGVNQRRRELGIRSALGATARQLRRLVLIDGARTAGIGLALGGGAGWFLARGLSSLQYGVNRSDPETWLAILGVLGATTLVASWLPARRAGRVDVAAMIRED